MDNYITSFKERFQFAGECYSEVSLEKVNKKQVACYFDGKEYKTLQPSESECEFNYFRKLNEEPVYIDVGGCHKVIGRIKETYRWVYFSKEKKNTNAVLQMFERQFDDHLSLTIKNINRDQNKLLMSECGTSFDIKLKNWTYFSLDFQISYKYDNCQINEC